MDPFLLLKLPSLLLNAFKLPKDIKLLREKANAKLEKIPTLRERKLGINFNYSSFIGITVRGNTVSIPGVYISAEGSLEKIQDAYIKSNINGVMLPIKFSTKHNGYLSVAEAKRCQLDSRIYLQALVRDSTNQEGQEFHDFIQDFRDFSFILIVDGKKVEMKRFTPHKINKHLRKLFPPNIDAAAYRV